MKFIERRKIVDAVQYCGNHDEVIRFVESAGFKAGWVGDKLIIYLHTRGHGEIAYPGEFIVKERGNLAILSCGQFTAEYEPYEGD